MRQRDRKKKKKTINHECGRKSKRTRTSEEESGGIGMGDQMPQNHVLHLIIDILQRRDTYEIFAEPVDPNEVEDYYEIVKDPMDFGTMRAKLHQGLYKTLDQFKHDVFLITRNAMHFNSSNTIYFRQARAIQELAKRIFHVLVTAPQNLELKFSGTSRRRPSTTTPSTLVNFKPSTLSNIIAPLPSQGNKTNAFFPAPTGATDHDPNRRCTYTPPFASKSFLPNTLILRNEEESNYMKSLWSFVQDLGPTAKTIATRKIEAANSICLGFSQYAATHGAVKPTSSSRCIDDDTKKTFIPKTKAKSGGLGGCFWQQNEDGSSSHCSSPDHDHGATKSSSEGNGNGNGNVIPIPVVLALEHSQSNANKRSFISKGPGPSSSRAPSSSTSNNNMAAPVQKLQTLMESGEDEEEKNANIPRPFTFNLGFLKAQLYQMKNVNNGYQQIK